MISIQHLEEVIFQTIVRGATVISPDVKAAFDRAIEKETSSAAKTGLERTCQSILLSKDIARPACPDTGWPIFYFKVGNDCQLEGGFMALEEATRRAVARATKEGYLRATMKHPLTGYDPGNNIGMNIPDFTYQFVDGDAIEISYAAKGGGSECFGGTRHRVVAFADGIKGIEKFVIDSFVEATRSGGICPPNVLGIGIGGSLHCSGYVGLVLGLPVASFSPCDTLAERHFVMSELVCQRGIYGLVLAYLACDLIGAVALPSVAPSSVKRAHGVRIWSADQQACSLLERQQIGLVLQQHHQVQIILYLV